MKRIKKVGIVLWCIMLIFLMSACTPSDVEKVNGDDDELDPIACAHLLVQDGESYELPRPPKPDKKYTIGVLLPHLANPHFVAQAYGYYDEAEQLGAELVLFECGGYEYVEVQVQQMEDLVAMGVDAIILVSVDLTGTIAAVDAAVEAGIPVVNVNVMTDAETVSARVRSPDKIIGRLQAEYHAEKLGGKGNVLMMVGPQVHQ